MNKKLPEYEIANPDAGSHFQSSRSLGYSLPSAISDIIDNSITAHSKNIWIVHRWDYKDSWIAILDDGDGMTLEELKNAMILGSSNPNDKREIDDLGRFGLGMKTASISQCKRMTVRTKTKKKNISTRCWDIDFLEQLGGKEYALLKNAYKESEDKLSILDFVDGGTVVLWENMDRIVDDFNDPDEGKDSFYKSLEEVENYIKMVFHRFIDIGGKLNIYICQQDEIQEKNGKISGWDPFLIKKKNYATIEKPEQNILNTKIKMTGYILPHISKLNDLDHKEASGIYGWNQHQGFYVYRNKRLISAGTWLNTGIKKDEHAKLARIRLDIPTNEFDIEWKIDITKSEIIPPPSVEKELRIYARLVRSEAVNVYRYRGNIVKRQSKKIKQFIWKIKRLRNNRIKYIIDKSHPLVEELINNIGIKSSKLTKLFSLISETLPIGAITINNSENPECHNYEDTIEDFTAFSIKDKFIEIVKELVSNGKTKKEAIEITLSMEPFNHFPELISFADEVN